jgi:hypothetical protein
MSSEYPDHRLIKSPERRRGCGSKKQQKYARVAGTLVTEADPGRAGGLGFKKGPVIETKI